jgi:hypothetical protein
MKAINLISAILYTLLFAGLLLAGVRQQQNPYQLAGTLLIAGPVVFNWLTIFAWNNSASVVKKANLFSGIIYASLLMILLLMGIAQAKADLILGTLLLGLPVLSNWLSYFKWPRPVKQA